MLVGDEAQILVGLLAFLLDLLICCLEEHWFWNLFSISIFYCFSLLHSGGIDYSKQYHEYTNCFNPLVFDAYLYLTFIHTYH